MKERLRSKCSYLQSSKSLVSVICVSHIRFISVISAYLCQRFVFLFINPSQFLSIKWSESNLVTMLSDEVAISLQILSNRNTNISRLIVASIKVS